MHLNLDGTGSTTGGLLIVRPKFLKEGFQLLNRKMDKDDTNRRITFAFMVGLRRCWVFTSSIILSYAKDQLENLQESNVDLFCSSLGQMTAFILVFLSEFYRKK